MAITAVKTRVKVRNILHLTDFSKSSEEALRFAIALARENSARVYGLHALVPGPYMYMGTDSTAVAIEAQQERAQEEMRKIESRLAGLKHQTTVEQGSAFWPIVKQSIKDHEIDLIVLGTRGRTGMRKLLLGSVAEEVVRRAPVPVLTIGPAAHGAQANGRFHNILFATDFTKESLVAVPHAISTAERNQAQLLLLHVIRMRDLRKEEELGELSIANAMHQLHEIVPGDTELTLRPRALVEHGKPGDRILDVASQHEVDLIVLGIRRGMGFLGASTHLEQTTAHRVLAHARCPVLTVRG
jgi:nucleotide-binding universal stress UspA family protein